MVKQLLLANAPSGMPVPELGRSDSTFELKEIELPELKEDQVLLQTIFFSNDPAQRGWIQKDQDADRLYIPPVRPGDLMLAGALCKVLKSTSASVKEGALLELPASNSGLLGEFWFTIATNNNINKKMFNMFTDEIGKTIGKHQVVPCPSIGRYKSLEEPKARESLLTPGMQHSTSKSSFNESSSSATLPSSSSPSLTVKVPSLPTAKN
ncbi:GroES-like protein [Gymnopus androsaceus JB14]|uniref:GroES-like protein n=1 Tax=Gymnopus androsaceus JB14 TaxID=1447944 RepID=A0A6A4IGU0_9AGAR|nr:GroES-like protein [Gymnopus androsaceus JB14]